MPNIMMKINNPFWLVLAFFSIMMIFLTLYIGESEFFEMEMKDNANNYFKNIQNENDSSVGFIEQSNSDLSKLSLYEGVDIRIEGVQVDTVYFDKDNSNGIENYNGKWHWDHNRIRLDPDLPNRGLPDLLSFVSSPRPLFSSDGFFDKLFGDRYSLSKNLKEALSEFRVIDSFRWLNGDEYIEIQQHVLEFHVDVGTQYNTKNDFEYDLPNNIKIDVFGNDFDKDREWDKQRYPSTQVVLKFTPQIFELSANDNPRKANFAIAAVEIIGIENPKLDNKKNFKASIRSDGGFGADVDMPKGRLLPLFNKLEDIPLIKSKYDQGSASPPNEPQNISRAILPFKSLEGMSSDEIINKNIFNKEQYSVISIANIGTWKEGNAFIGRDLYAEAVRYKFALHLFVYGDWVAKFEPVTTWDAITTQSHSGKSFIDRALSGLWSGFIPGFNLGGYGQVIFIIFMVIVLSPFIPVLAQLVQFLVFIFNGLLKLSSKIAKNG